MINYIQSRFFNNEEYCEPIKSKDVFYGNYLQYENQSGKNKDLLFEEIRSHFSELINQLKNHVRHGKLI